MSKSQESLKALLLTWDKLKVSRGSERDFTPHGYPNLGYAAFDEIFNRWKTSLEALNARQAWATSPEGALADHPLSLILNDINGIVGGAVPNGVSWMLSSNFVNRVSDAHNLISSVTSRRISITREVAKELTSRGLSDLENVIAAGDAAKTVIASETKAESASALVQGISEAAGKTKEDVEARSAAIEKLFADTTTSAAAAEASRLQIEAAFKGITDMKVAADAREAALSLRVSDLDQQISETMTEAIAARASVAQALRSAREEGLAKSFQSRSNILRFERRAWNIIFVGALAILTAVSITFVLELGTLSYESLTVSLLRRIALAAPLVWLGWYAAKQISRVGRVQEDYEYKAASALAFQSYKEEAKVSGDATLSDKLLRNAIETFGENPVRLYEDHKSDPVSPMESLVKQLPPEALAALGAILTAASKKPLT